MAPGAILLSSIRGNTKLIIYALHIGGGDIVMDRNQYQAMAFTITPQMQAFTKTNFGGDDQKAKISKLILLKEIVLTQQQAMISVKPTQQVGGARNHRNKVADLGVSVSFHISPKIKSSTSISATV